MREHLETADTIRSLCWIMFTADGCYPIQATPECKPEDHGRLNGHIIRIEDLDGDVLWQRPKQ